MIGLWLVLGLAQAQSDGLGECENAGTLFTRITTDAGVRAYGASKGVTINDLDGDGDLDLYVASGPSRVEDALWLSGESLVYLSEFSETGELVFTEVGGEWGVDDLCEDRSPMFGDLDNDGLPDLYISVNGRNLLYRNQGGASPPFLDVTAQSGAAGHVGWGHQGFLFDFDRDGFLDVFFTNGPEDGSAVNTLLRNQGDGTLIDHTELAGVGGTPSGKGTCVLDADDDGWPDIFVTTGREYPNQLFMNQRDGTFSDQAALWGVEDPEHRFGVGTVCEDLDNDGDVDILLITHDKVYGGNQLFENRGGRFIDAGVSSGLAEWVDGHGSDIVDIDLDGYQDIVLSGIKTQPYVLRNNGDLTFTRLCDGAGITTEEGVTWGVVAADMNEDGYPEVLVSHGLGRRPRDNEFFLNLGSGNHWIKVDVQGVTHNPSQLGAKVQVTAGGMTRTRWVGDWSSFDSQGPLTLTFGLGDATTVDEVVVTFTNGTTATVVDVAADQVLSIVEEAARSDDDADGVPDEWDSCPGTRLGWRTDGVGCATGQRAGIGLAADQPGQDAVLTEAPTFSWTASDPASAVVQISLDGTFGPAGRVDWGPVGGTRYTPTDAEWAQVIAASDGSRPLLWRVVAVTESGAEGLTDPRRFYGAIHTNLVRIPQGVNIFEPAHVVVPVGEPITWWNDSVSAGNLQNEIHDISLVAPDGRVISSLHELNGAGWFTTAFDEVGTYTFVCHRHSGPGTHGDQSMETAAHIYVGGPFRCMAGTVTVE
jgi:plastocyanin